MARLDLTADDPRESDRRSVLLSASSNERVAVRSCRCVGTQPAVWRDSKGRRELLGSLPLAFLSFHGPVISKALWALLSRLSSRGAFADSSFTWRSNTAFFWRIFRSNPVSLIRSAPRSRPPKLITGLSNVSAPGTAFSFSKGVS